MNLKADPVLELYHPAILDGGHFILFCDRGLRPGKTDLQHIGWGWRRDYFIHNTFLDNRHIFYIWSNSDVGKIYSYIKWVEAGGARAVPVIIGKSKEYYKQVRTWFLSWWFENHNPSCLTAWTGCCCQEAALPLLEVEAMLKLASSFLSGQDRLALREIEIRS